MDNENKTLTALTAAALAFHLFAGVSFIRSAAPTYDEPVHLAGGYCGWAAGQVSTPDHPPLAQMLSALPLLALRPGTFAASPFFAKEMTYEYADIFLYENSVPAGRLLNTARLFGFLLWTALSVLFLYKLAFRLAGAPAALLSVAVFSFMPVFLSNNALVTTDAGGAVFFLGAVAAACRFSRSSPAAAPGGSARRELGWAALAGVLSGLAMASKFSMYILPPLIAALWLLDGPLQGGIKRGRLLTACGLLLAAAALTVVVVYRFHPGLYFSGLSATLGRLSEGRSSFAWGNYYPAGVWWYFPFAFAVKTPLAVMFLGLAGLFACFRLPGRNWVWVLVPPAVYFAASFFSKVQLGCRHILPVMPFAALAAGIGAAWIIKARRYLPAAAAAVLVLSWGWLLLRTHPYYLAYFNELAGGPANGSKLLADSNLDWGQDIKTAAAWLKGRGNPPVILSYFGTARPESYGIKYVPLEIISNIALTGTGVDVCGMKEALLAVSAGNLQGINYTDKRTFFWLKSRKPVFSAGYSIFIYDLSSDKEGLEDLAALFASEGREPEANCLYARAAALSR